MAIEYRKIDIHSVSDHVLQGIHEASVDRHRNFYPDDPDLTLEYHKANWRAPQGVHRKEQWWVALDGDDVVGSSRATTWADHEDSGLIVTAVKDSYRRRGVGAGLLGHSLDDLEEEGRSKLIIDAPENSPAEPRLESLGLKMALGERVSRLAVGDVDWDLIKDWIANASERAADYSLMFFDSVVPEEHLENWARVNNVMNSAPLEGLELEDFNMTPEMWRSIENSYGPKGLEFRGCAAVHGPTGDFAGLTVLMNQRYEPWLGVQDDTGVDPEHRNKGLGRWMKAAMLERFMAEFPDVTHIETGNAGSNEPMLNINIAMGFETVLVVNAWQGDISTVRERLNR